MIVYAPHKADPKHLARVMDQMRTLGAPEIRAYFNGEVWYAVEGSHRLAAARELGLTPNMVELELDSHIQHDIEDARDEDGDLSDCVKDIINCLYDSPPYVTYIFDAA